MIENNKENLIETEEIIDVGNREEISLDEGTNWFECEDLIINMNPVVDKFNMVINSTVTPEEFKPDTAYLLYNKDTGWELSYCNHEKKITRYLPFTKKDIYADLIQVLKEINISNESNSIDEEISEEAKLKVKTALKKIMRQHEKRVDINSSNCGKKLFSDDFGPCVAVVAILKNGEICIYHCYIYGESPELNKFIESIEDATKIFVIRKTKSVKNYEMSSVLAITIINKLNNKDIPLTMVTVPNYRVVLAEENTIIIGVNCVAKSIESGWFDTSKKTPLSSKQFCSIEKDIISLLNNYSYEMGGETSDKQRGVYIDDLHLFIPENLIIHTAQSIQKPKNTQVETASGYNPKFYKKKDELLESLKIINVETDNEKTNFCCNIL